MDEFQAQVLTTLSRLETNQKMILATLARNEDIPERVAVLEDRSPGRAGGIYGTIAGTIVAVLATLFNQVRS